MNDKSQIVQIESETSPGTFYSVNTKSLTCTCQFFLRELAGLPLTDPHRLCKHLTQAKDSTKRIIGSSIVAVTISVGVVSIVDFTLSPVIPSVVAAIGAALFASRMAKQI